MFTAPLLPDWPFLCICCHLSMLHYLSPFSFSGSLIEELKSSKIPLLLCDLLTFADSFNTSAYSSTNGLFPSCGLTQKFLLCSACVLLVLFLLAPSHLVKKHSACVGKGAKVSINFNPTKGMCVFCISLTTILFFLLSCLFSNGRDVCGFADTGSGSSPGSATFGPAGAHPCQHARSAE